MSDTPLFSFKMRAVDRPHDAYYETRWDLAIPLEIVAETKKEAIAKAELMLGPAEARRYWVYRVDAIRDFLLEKEVNE